MSAPQVVYAPAPGGGFGIGTVFSWIGTLIGLFFLGLLLYFGYMAFIVFKTASDPMSAITNIFDKVGLGEIGKGFGDVGKFLSGGGNKECQQKYGPNAFWDAENGGTCYSCPSGHKMQVFETLNSNKKCALTNCPSGYENDTLLGKCVKCDAGYNRTLDHAASATACCKGFLCSGGKRRAQLKNKWTNATKKGSLNEKFETTHDNYKITNDTWTNFRYLRGQASNLIID